MKIRIFMEYFTCSVIKVSCRNTAILFKSLLILFNILNLSANDSYNFYTDQEFYKESQIASLLTINSRSYGINESIERSILKVENIKNEKALVSGVTFLQNKTKEFRNYSMRNRDQANYRTYIDKKGRTSFTTGRMGIRNFPILPDENLPIGETYLEDAQLFLTIQPDKRIPDLFLEITYLYRYLGTQIIENEEISTYSAKGVVYQEKNKAIFHSYKILKVVGFSDNIIKFNRTQGFLISIDEYFDWTFILKDHSVVEFNGTTSTTVKTPPPLPVENLMKIINNKDYHGITMNKALFLSINIENIRFEPDSSFLKESEKLRIDEIVSILKEIGVSKLIIAGHTADIGLDEAQLKLSEKRAEEVYNYLLTSHSFDVNNISFTGKGGREPIDDNSTPEGRSRNRRVEFIILPD